MSNVCKKHFYSTPAKLHTPDARPDTPHIRSNSFERTEMGPCFLAGLEVRWEVLHGETTVCSVCIWLEFFRQFLGRCQKVTPAERLKIYENPPS